MVTILMAVLVALSTFATAAVGVGNGDDEPEARLRAIREAIEEKGAQWEAGETSLSGLSNEEFRRMLGVQPELIQDEVGEAQQARKIQVGQPNQIDWRQKDGQNWTTPVRDQGPCGSCAAFGALGAFEARLDIYEDDPSFNWDGSEAHLFWCGGGSCDTGWTMGAALSYLRSNGVPDEACWPYPSTPYDLPCRTTCADWRQRVRGISDYTGFSGESAMETHLLDGPITAAFDVYEDFRDYTGGVYEHVWGEYLGGHGVAIVGYNDVENYWIAKNSWGTGWGESGWFKIRYGQCKIDTYASYAVTVCPATAALEGESKGSDLDLLRRFRDEILVTSPTGRKYARLYYKYTPELTRLLISDAELRGQTREMLQELMPGFRGLLDEGPEQEMVLSEEMVEAINALMSDFAARAGPGLRAVIKQMQGQLVDFEGKTFEEIRSLTSAEAERGRRPGWRVR
jgi:hypothetical protein